MNAKGNAGRQHQLGTPPPLSQHPTNSDLEHIASFVHEVKAAVPSEVLRALRPFARGILFAVGLDWIVF